MDQSSIYPRRTSRLPCETRDLLNPASFDFYARNNRRTMGKSTIKKGCKLIRFEERVTALSLRKNDRGDVVLKYEGYINGNRYEGEDVALVFRHSLKCPCLHRKGVGQ